MPSAASSDIAPAFDRYMAAHATLTTVKSAISRAAEIEFDRLKAHEARLAENGHRHSLIVAGHNHSFKTAQTGKPHFYLFTNQTIEVQREALLTRLNRQYQWLLAESYELFEDFAEYAYACAALADRSFWPLRDYGALRLEQLPNLTLDQLLELAKKKADKPQSLLLPLRSRLPQIVQAETKNKLNANLWLTVHLVARLRHHVVHTRGLVADSAKLSTDVLKAAGLSNNGKPEQIYVDFIARYIAKRQGAHIVDLLDVLGGKIGPIQEYNDVFAELTDLLLAYALVIVQCFGAIPSVEH